MSKIDIDIDSCVNAIKSTLDVKKVIKIITEIFSPIELELGLAKNVKEISPLNTYKVLTIQDRRFENHEILRANARHILNAFILFLDKSFLNNKYSIDEKFHHLNFLGNYFTIESETFNISNLFSFSGPNSFYTIIEGQFKGLEMNNLVLNDVQKEIISDFFNLRYWFYKELVRAVNRFILRIELDNYSYSEIQLTDEGVTVITELIMAIEKNKKYVKIDSQNPKTLEDRFSKVFGISGTKFSKKRDNLENNKTLGRHLVNLGSNMKIATKKQ